MPTHRIALACAPIPTSGDQALAYALEYIEQAASLGADIVCFPECYVPGYRYPGTPAASARPNPELLARADETVAHAAAAAKLTVVLGTERIRPQGLQITAKVFGPNGELLGQQDKCQLDPSEESIYAARGQLRQVFTVGALSFGIVICHEGFRYP